MRPERGTQRRSACVQARVISLILEVPGKGDMREEKDIMSKATFSAMSLTGVLLLAMTAGVPTLAYADDGYRSVSSVRVGYRDHDGYRDRGSHRNRGGYSYRDSHKHYKHRGHSHGHGHYVRPHHPTTYYVVPRYRSYHEPRYYGGGRSGWDIDLHYYFRD